MDRLYAPGGQEHSSNQQPQQPCLKAPHPRIQQGNFAHLLEREQRSTDLAATCLRSPARIQKSSIVRDLHSHRYIQDSSWMFLNVDQSHSQSWMIDNQIAYVLSEQSEDLLINPEKFDLNIHGPDSPANSPPLLEDLRQELLLHFHEFSFWIKYQLSAKAISLPGVYLPKHHRQWLSLDHQ